MFQIGETYGNLKWMPENKHARNAQVGVAHTAQNIKGA